MTSGLPGCRFWEVALVVWRGPRRDEFVWFVHQADLDLDGADCSALRDIRARHPQIAPGGDGRPPLRERQVLDLVSRQLRGAELVTLKDATEAVLAARLGARLMAVPWAGHSSAPLEDAPPPAVRQLPCVPGALGAARRAEALFHAVPVRYPG